MASTPPMGRLPALFTGRRRGQIVMLVLTGLVQAVAGAASALLAPHILTAPTTGDRAAVVGLLALSAAVIGLATWAGRVVSERLAQGYVHRLRLDLVRAALTGQEGTSLGITVARTTNDLTAVRNWIILGIVPLLSGVPVLLGAIAGLALLHPWLAIAGAIPALALAAGHLFLAPAAYERARAVRRQRGRLAGHITDTVVAGDGIRRAGGISREVSALSDRSSELVDRTVHRAVVTGGMRGLAAGLVAFAVTCVAWIGSIVGVEATTITSAYMLVGMLTVPLADLGRLVELRQGFLAAEVIIAPQVERAREFREEERRRAERPQARDLLDQGRSPEPGVVHLRDLNLGEGPIDLLAHPGERLIVTDPDRDKVQALIDALTGDLSPSVAWVDIAGHRLLDLPSKARRLLVGLADDQVVLEQGTIARAVRYRVPDSDEDVAPLLDLVGLELPHLPKGERTRLRRGGQPLTASERARVHLARALYGTPPLLVLDRVDAALGAGGESVLRDAIRSYPGVVVYVPTDPGDIEASARVVPDARAVALTGRSATL